MNPNYYEASPGYDSRSKSPNAYRVPHAQNQRAAQNSSSIYGSPRDYQMDPRRPNLNNASGYSRGSYYEDARIPPGSGYPRGGDRRHPQAQASRDFQSPRDFVELDNLPSNVKAAGGRDFQRPISPDTHHPYHNEEHSNLIRGPRHESQYSLGSPPDSNYAQLQNSLPSHVKSSATLPTTNSNYAELQNALPSHVKPSYVPHSESSNFASPSKGFNAMAYQAPLGVTNHTSHDRRRERSCFGLCLCSGKMCVIVTTVSTLLIGLIFFFLWMRRPGFAPSGDLIFKSPHFASTNETLSIFHADIQYQILITNSNFYPITLTKMNAKVFDGATGMQVGQGVIKNVYIPPLNQAFTNLTLTLDYRVASDQDKTWQDFMAACPLAAETATRVPLATRTQIEAYFNVFSWANFIPKDTLQRNLLCS